MSSDKEYIAALNNDSEKAFRAIYDAHYKLMLGVGINITHDKDNAQQIRLGVYNMLNTRNVAFNTIDYQDPITGAISSSPLYSLPIMPSFSYRISF